MAVGDAFDLADATSSLEGASRLVHLAGVNRGAEEDVREQNPGFADQIAAALRQADQPPPVVVYANSIQAADGGVYGVAKARAADSLARAAADVGAEFIDLRLPNLFGEHGRPFYNAVTATFSHLLAAGGTPQVDVDRELTLLHAQNAADLLLGTVPLASQRELEEHETVSGLLERLSDQARTYATGEIPDIGTPFDRDLFNTYRSYTFPAHAPVALTKHADARGAFFEVVRSHGGPGQSSFSTTQPGVGRGDHFHRRKIERFTVLSGRATISLRRLFGDEVVEFEVTGDDPVAVDMPTFWAHKIVNTGDDVLYTSFWTNDIFDPDRPDTIAEAV
nr:capsular biosynthesis protein [Microbacterium marinilacus]